MIGSVGSISKPQQGLDSDADFLTSLDMLAELHDDNLRRASGLGVSLANSGRRAMDVATVSLVEVWTDETECSP